jgi:hypothetical protein
MINLDKHLTTKPKYLIGLLQAGGVASYILLLVALATNFGSLIEHSSQILAPMIFLTTFVTSALICGSIVLAYPAWLAVQRRSKDAIEIIAWSIAWLLIILFTVIFIAILR